MNRKIGMEDSQESLELTQRSAYKSKFGNDFHARDLQQRNSIASRSASSQSRNAAVYERLKFEPYSNANGSQYGLDSKPLSNTKSSLIHIADQRFHHPRHAFAQ